MTDRDEFPNPIPSLLFKRIFITELILKHVPYTLYRYLIRYSSDAKEITTHIAILRCEF